MCASAGDDQQLRELQTLLRTDFLSETPRGHLGADITTHDSVSNYDSSLQFAWETIHEQKKEIVRLRAEVDAFQQQSIERSTALDHSFFSNDGKKGSPSIDLLRSQISSHHDNNVAMLHDHITSLEKALHRATMSPASVLKSSKRIATRFDASATTVDSSRGHDSATDFSRSYSSRESATGFSKTTSSSQLNSCDQCHRKSISILTLEAEARQLRAQLAADQEALAMAEDSQEALKSENLALATAMSTAKQSQGELRTLVVELRTEKTQLQEIMISYREASEATAKHLRAQLANLEAAQQQHLRSQPGVGSKSFVSSANGELENSYQLRLSVLENAIQEMKIGVQEREVSLWRASTNVGDKREIDSEIAENNTRVPSPVSKLGSMNKEHVFEAELAESRRLIGQLDAEKHDLQTELARKDSELISHDAQILKLKSSLEKVNQDKSKLVAELDDERDRSKEAGREYDMLLSKFDALKLELSDVRDARDNLSSEVEEIGKHLSVTKARYEEADTSNQSYKSKLKRLTEDVADAEATQIQFSKLRVAHQALRAELETKQLELTEKTRQLQDLNNQLKQEIADTKTTVLMWMSKHNALEGNMCKTEEELASAQEEKYDLKRQLEEATIRHNNAIVTLRTELKAQFQLDANKSIRTANETLAAANQSVAERYHSRIKQLEDDNEELKRQIVKHESEIQALIVVDEKRKKTLMLVESASQQLNEEARASKLERQRVQHQLASCERERSTLKLLVNTLEARPQLQKQALMEMISRSFRELENTSIVQLSNRIDVAKNRLETICSHQKKLSAKLISTPADSKSEQYRVACQTVRDLAAQSKIPALQSLHVINTGVDLAAVIHYLFSWATRIYSDDNFEKMSIEDLPPAARGKSSQSTAPHKPEQPRKSGVAVTFGESGSGWFGPVSPLNSMQSVTDENIVTWNMQRYRRPDAVTCWREMVGRLIHVQRWKNTVATYKHIAAKWKVESRRREQTARSWRWRYVAYAFAAAGSSRRAKLNHIEVMEQELTLVRLKAQIRSSEQQSKANMAMLFQLNQSVRRWILKSHFFSWRFHTALRKIAKRLDISEAERRKASAVFTPETTKTLGNCIYLLQRFCDDGVSADTARYRMRENAILGRPPHALFHTRESLVKMLEKSNHKVAGWQVVLDKKMSELADSKQRLRKLNSRCSELNDLVSLNQRLIAEMERRLSTRESIVEAAWEVATSFRQLPRETLLSQGSESFKMLTIACDSLIDALHSFRVSRRTTSKNAAKAKALAQSTLALEKAERSGDIKQVTFASSQNLLTPSQCPKSRQPQFVEVDTLSISMLEDAVVSLRSVGKNRELLDKALTDTRRLLNSTQIALRRRNRRFHIMRAFVQWKCRTLRMQSRDHK